MSRSIAEKVGREVLEEAASRYQSAVGLTVSSLDGILPDEAYLDNFDAALFEMAEVADVIATEFHPDQTSQQELVWAAISRSALRGTGLDSSRLLTTAGSTLQAELYADVVGKREVMSGLDMEVPLSELAV